MEDQYQFAESLDGRTLSYVEEKNAEFKRKYGAISEVTRGKIASYVRTKIVLQSMVSRDNVATLFRVDEKYQVSLNGDVVMSSDNVISWITLSDDGNRIALFETSGSDKGKLKILKDRKIIQEITGNISQLVFTPDSFYLVKSFTDSPPPDGGEKNSHRVLMDGKVVFGSGLESTKFIDLHKSKEKMIVVVGNWNSSSIYFGDLEDPTGWMKVRDLHSTCEAVGIVEGEVCYLERTGNGILKLGDRSVVEFSFPVTSCNIVKEGFLVSYQTDAKLGVSLFNMLGEKVKDFPLNDPMGLISSDSDEENATLVMDSFGIPFSQWTYRNLSLEKVEENRILDLAVEDRWVQSTGVKIHYFLIDPASRDKKRALAYGYGGYSVSLMPSYSPLYAMLLSDGIAVAQANLRGGGECGKEWHDSGILDKKQNVFDDFISVIVDLKNQGYGVVAKGESNGGLLVGAVLTQRPEILNGAVIGVPVLDMLRFHVMSVGKYWTTEYGNPDSERDHEFLRKYSPYHNLNKRNYPKTLIWSRLNDDRVHPAHAIKFHMKISESSPDSYLRIEASGGHSGIRPAEEIQHTCEIFDFITDCFK